MSESNRALVEREARLPGEPVNQDSRAGQAAMTVRGARTVALALLEVADALREVAEATRHQQPRRY